MTSCQRLCERADLVSLTKSPWSSVPFSMNLENCLRWATKINVSYVEKNVKQQMTIWYFFCDNISYYSVMFDRTTVQWIRIPVLLIRNSPIVGWGSRTPRVEGPRIPVEVALVAILCIFDSIRVSLLSWRREFSGDKIKMLKSTFTKAYMCFLTKS